MPTHRRQHIRLGHTASQEEGKVNHFTAACIQGRGSRSKCGRCIDKQRTSNVTKNEIAADRKASAPPIFCTVRHAAKGDPRVGHCAKPWKRDERGKCSKSEARPPDHSGGEGMYVRKCSLKVPKAPSATTSTAVRDEGTRPARQRPCRRPRVASSRCARRCGASTTRGNERTHRGARQTSNTSSESFAVSTLAPRQRACEHSEPRRAR